ncbi:unnamed protein product [Rodentolepis nana]|uniref:Uncharacterized protein n=1 Tax=Rodentolepis nana TaxID=102285 RepID=A0A0R3U0H6_RODNA|nr:unnamed protein product [Rodentolepis nana]
MLSTTTKDYQVTRGRLASLFMPSTTQDFNNYSSSESQRRKPKRRTLMPRFICYARENLFNSTVSADSNEALHLLWNGWRRRRCSSRGSYLLMHESHKLVSKLYLIYFQDHQTQSEKENVPASKLVPPQIMSRRRVLFLRSRKSLHATALRQHVIEEKRLMEPSLDLTPRGAPWATYTHAAKKSINRQLTLEFKLSRSTASHIRSLPQYSPLLFLYLCVCLSLLHL